MRAFASDIASLGINVDVVSPVIDFEMPNVPEGHVHRIGRTARVGATGIVIAFCGDDERPYRRDIEHSPGGDCGSRGCPPICRR